MSQYQWKPEEVSLLIAGISIHLRLNLDLTARCLELINIMNRDSNLLYAFNQELFECEKEGIVSKKMLQEILNFLEH